MPPTRQPALRLPLDGPTNRELVNRERIDWHDHAEHQLIHPSRGVLRVFTALGVWVVPPHRAVWIPASVPHAHQAHGPTRMRTLSFDASVNPLRTDRPTVLAVTPLLRELIISLTEHADGTHKADGAQGAARTARTGAAASTDAADPGDPAEATGPPYTPRQRLNLERVALDQFHRVDALPFHLPAPTDDRLRAVAGILHADPSDDRSLAELGTAVGASERTLSRLFRREIGMSFPQWRTQLRLHHSLVLLAADGSVTTVATACGYANPSAFIEAFRHAFGTTPGRHRSESDRLPPGVRAAD
jgi:AraC-like DNA-binding protein